MTERSDSIKVCTILPRDLYVALRKDAAKQNAWDKPITYLDVLRDILRRHYGLEQVEQTAIKDS